MLQSTICPLRKAFVFVRMESTIKVVHGQENSGRLLNLSLSGRFKRKKSMNLPKPLTLLFSKNSARTNDDFYMTTQTGLFSKLFLSMLMLVVYSNSSVLTMTLLSFYGLIHGVACVPKNRMSSIKSLLRYGVNVLRRSGLKNQISDSLAKS